MSPARQGAAAVLADVAAAATAAAQAVRAAAPDRAAGLMRRLTAFADAPEIPNESTDAEARRLVRLLADVFAECADALRGSSATRQSAPPFRSPVCDPTARETAGLAESRRRALDAALRIQAGDQTKAAFAELETALLRLYDAAVARSNGVDAVTAACVQRTELSARAPFCTAPEVAHLVHLVRGALEAVP